MNCYEFDRLQLAGRWNFPHFSKMLRSLMGCSMLTGLNLLLLSSRGCSLLTRELLYRIWSLIKSSGSRLFFLRAGEFARVYPAVSSFDKDTISFSRYGTSPEVRFREAILWLVRFRIIWFSTRIFVNILVSRLINLYLL